jgi:hypothetical protein
MNVRTKIIINKTIEKVKSFNYSRYTITVSNNRDLEIKMNRFNQMCRIIKHLIKKQGKRHEVL